MDPKTFLDRWFGRPGPTPELASALSDLERLGTERPELAGAARSLAALLVAAFDGSDPSLEFDREAAGQSWSEGRPCFQAHPPRLDQARLMSRLRRIVEAIGPEARPFARAIDFRKFDLMACVAEVLAGRPESLVQEAEKFGIDPELVSSTLRMTLLPSLAEFSAILDRSRPEGAWKGGDCPQCGSRPLLAESRGLEQRIAYRCGLCAGDWPGERLGCPSCGEVESKALHYSFIEGEQDRCRLAHCDTCRYDWKVVSTLTALTPPAMIVADLATLHLDILAADRRGESL